MMFAMKCPKCKNPLPAPRETSYIMETGLTKVQEYICVFCKTKVLVPEVS